MESKETFGAEIGKQIPVKEVYNDLAHPALSNVGQGLLGVTKLALAPITGMVWGYEKISAYLDKAIPAYFEKKKIEKNNIVTPDPMVAVPLLEAMRYTSHKEELKGMFTNLLGAAMTKDCIDEHPAFVEIIKQLTPDECKMLKHLKNNNIMPMIRLQLKLDEGKGEIDVTPYFSDLCFNTGCEYPNKFPQYLNNLQRLGLVEASYERFFTDNNRYDSLRKHPQFPHIDRVITDGNIVEKKAIFELTELGKRFCYICVD